MTRQLTNQSKEATESQNITGVESPILTIQPEDGLSLILRGMVGKGSDPGLPIYADLRDSSGGQLPEDTTVKLQFQSPNMDDPTTIAYPWEHIRPYNSKTIKEQQDEDKYLDTVKHEFKNTAQALANGEVPQVTIRDIDEFRFVIESSAQIDWAESAVYIERTAVVEA